MSPKCFVGRPLDTSHAAVGASVSHRCKQLQANVRTHACAWVQTHTRMKQTSSVQQRLAVLQCSETVSSGIVGDSADMPRRGSRESLFRSQSNPQNPQPLIPLGRMYVACPAALRPRVPVCPHLRQGMEDVFVDSPVPWPVVPFATLLARARHNGGCPVALH